MQTIKYIPPILQDIKEFQVITACDDRENTTLNTCIENLYKDQFISTATEAALKRYESILGIIPKGEDTLADRRFRVLAIYNKQLPYTRTVLEQNLTTFCGKDGYRLVIDYVNKVLTVKINLAAKSMFETVKNYLEGVIPLNLLIDLILIYNQHKTLKRFTHEHLKQFSLKQLREEVIL